jgi:hypothetical protein
MGAQVAPADQQNISQPMITNGTSGTINVTALQATAGASSVYQFNEDFTFVYNQTITSFRQGGIYALDAALLAALTAASAPMTFV